MRRSSLLGCVVKEVRLLASDLHGLALLFLMPLTFILVMSLALQDSFAARGAHSISVLWRDHDSSANSRALRDLLTANEAFALSSDAGAPRAKHAFIVDIPAGYGQTLANGAKGRIKLMVGADTDARTMQIFRAALSEAAGRQRMQMVLDGLGEADTDDALAPQIEIAYAYSDPGGRAPSAVQQNVPAWLVFAMFFVAIPLSNTFIRERQVGVQQRLHTMHVGVATQFIGKLLPYFVVNQMQVALMLGVGMFIAPLLGGEALQLHGSPLALASISAATSFAALGFAFLVAVTARTTEQATLFAGLGNILLAAIGGVMVPKFVMPAEMRAIADLSPMAWGLDGFLDLLLRGGGTWDIVPYVAKLAAFGVVTLGLATLRYRPEE